MTETFPLFLTPAAQAGDTLPADLLGKQMHILLGAGVSWDRLNPDLRATFLLGYYLGNVRNGGHSQFMGNARNYYDGDPVRFLDWAMEAAERYEMPESLTIMRDVRAWIAKNPKEAAIQKGFTPHVSPELKPYDRALFGADTVDEKTWLARVATLPKAHAKTFLHMRSYEGGFVRFPAIISEIEELRFLAAFDAVRVVADDAFEAQVMAAAAADPVATTARMSARLTNLAQALPKPATCAALSLFAEGAHLPATELLRVGAAKTRRPKRTGVLTTTGRDRVFVAELGKHSVSVFEATGDPDAVLEHGINFPCARSGLAARLFYFVDPRRRAERTFKRLVRQKTVRKTRKLGKVSNSVGDEIAGLNRRFHLPEALALWLEQAQDTTVPGKWRLEVAEANRIHWRFEVRNIRLNVIATVKEVQISSGDTTIIYPNDDLRVLRRSIEGTT